MNIKELSERDRVQALSIKYREAIVQAHKDNRFEDVRLREFPLGSCFIASVLLGKYLCYHGISTKIISASMPKDPKYNQTHAWLEYEDLIIDITADQFDEQIESVIFEKPKSFHDNYTNMNISDFNESYDVGSCLKFKIPDFEKIIQEYLAIEA